MFFFLILALILLILILLTQYVVQKFFTNEKKAPNDEVLAIIGCLNVIIEDNSKVLNIVIKNDQILWQSNNDIETNGVCMRKFNVFVNNNCYTVEVQEIHDHTTEQTKSCKFPPNPNEKTIIAPLQGTLIDIKVQNGQKVLKGDVLFVIEAMKMENEIKAIEDFVVSCVYVNKDDMVQDGDILLSY